jgi:hypothetical protein
MQREIKFRAKVKGDAGMWNVWAIDWRRLKVMLDGARDGEWTPMSKIQSLMQYINQKDINEVEICDGDIVQYQASLIPLVHETYQVVWLQNGFAYKQVGTEDQWVTYLQPTKLEVIGNIYQDKARLEELGWFEDEDAWSCFI